MLLQWIKQKLFGKSAFSFSEEYARIFQAQHTGRLENITKDLPSEFVSFMAKLRILNDNSWSVHHLYKSAIIRKNYAEAFLYFFYSFELTLKHLIMTEMMIANQVKFIEEQKDVFPIYSSDEINKVQEWTHMAKIIDRFCFLHGTKMEYQLNTINKERNFIIHNMMKKQLSEELIEKSFEAFFTKTANARSKFYVFVDRVLEDRPANILSRMKASIKNQSTGS